MGDVRIGVAVSDPTGIVVEPLTTIRAGTRAAAIEKIAELVEQEGVGEVVVGTPVSLDGEVGHRLGRYECLRTCWLSGYRSR